MKIVGIIKEDNGSKYHRIKLPLSFMKEDILFLKDITENDVKNIDILYIHWKSPVDIPILSIWKENFNFKIIADIDDTWILPEIHSRSVFQSKALCHLADAVICTNEYIKNQIIEYNKNVHIIPNYLPNDLQFKYEKRSDKKNEKINIGISGSISHFEDWLLLKKHIKKVIKQKELSEKINWYLIGVDDNPLWKEIIKFFPKDTIIKRYKNTEEYISLYNDLDIMLCPLSNNSFAKGRSALKIYECAQKDIIPIISDEYIKKDTLFKFLPTNDWVNNIRTLVFDDEYRMDIKDSLKIIRDSYDYQKDCVEKRLEIFKNVLNIKKQKKEYNIFSIKYLDSQLVEYKPVLNKINSTEQKSYFFEYNPMIDIVKKTETNEYVGIFSHKFPYKTGFYKKILFEILDKEKSDIIIFCKPIKNYLDFTEKCHPGFQKIFKKLCDKLDLQIRDKHIPTIYSNFFVAKGNIYREYIKILEKACNIMEEDEEIKKLCWQDANYKVSLSSEELFKYTGLKYYTFHTFILERLFSVWLDNSNFSISIYY